MCKKYMLLVLLAGVLMTSGVLAPLTCAQGVPRRIQVTAKQFAFDPEEITLKKGQPAVLVLTSTDVAHGLRFRELNVQVKVGAGGTAEVQFTPQEKGDFVGRCFVFCGKGHGTMALTLHVVD
jgi:cytochrome c oxidase subunit II